MLFFTGYSLIKLSIMFHCTLFIPCMRKISSCCQRNIALPLISLANVQGFVLLLVTEKYIVIPTYVVFFVQLSQWISIYPACLDVTVDISTSVALHLNLNSNNLPITFGIYFTSITWEWKKVSFFIHKTIGSSESLCVSRQRATFFRFATR